MHSSTSSSTMEQQQQYLYQLHHQHQDAPHLTTSTASSSTSLSSPAPKPAALMMTDDDQPKRPLSAYNIFFQVERQRLIGETKNKPQQQDGDDDKADKDGNDDSTTTKSNTDAPYTRAEVYSIALDKATRIEKSKRPHRKMHGMISFTNLAKTIANKWKALRGPEKALFEERADDEKRKYAIELEEWLVHQVPTNQVKKRLAALRRGSLKKYIANSTASMMQQHQMSAPSPTPTATEYPQEAFPEESGAAAPATEVSPASTRRTLSPASMSSSSSMTAARRVSDMSEHPSKSASASQQQQQQQLQLQRRKIQLERARNLERLYQMQIQLYNEQIKLHAECNGGTDLDSDLMDMPNSMPSSLYEPELPPPQTPMASSFTANMPRFVSNNSFPWREQQREPPPPPPQQQGLMMTDEPASLYHHSHPNSQMMMSPPRTTTAMRFQQQPQQPQHQPSPYAMSGGYHMIEDLHHHSSDYGAGLLGDPF